MIWQIIEVLLVSLITSLLSFGLPMMTKCKPCPDSVKYPDIVCPRPSGNYGNYVNVSDIWAHFFPWKMEYFDLFCISEVYMLDSCYPHTILPRILLGLRKFKLLFLSIFVCKVCRMIVVFSLFQLVCILQADLFRIVYLISSACWNVCFGVHATGSLLLFGQFVSFTTIK